MMCNNGLPGYEAANVCCALECGQCGGVGCSQLPGGKECCTSDVLATGMLCSESGTAPCIIDDAGDDGCEKFWKMCAICIVSRRIAPDGVPGNPVVSVLSSYRVNIRSAWYSRRHSSATTSGTLQNR